MDILGVKKVKVIKQVNRNSKVIIAVILLQLKLLIISLYARYSPNITAMKNDDISIKTKLFPIIPV